MPMRAGRWDGVKNLLLVCTTPRDLKQIYSYLTASESLSGPGVRLHPQADDQQLGGLKKL